MQPIVFRGPIDGISGYASKTRNLIFALKNYDIPIFIDPIKWATNRYSGLRQDITEYIYKLCQKKLPKKEDSLLLQINIGSKFIGKQEESYKKIYGYTLYEVSNAPSSYINGINKLDNLFVPNQFNYSVFYNSGVRIPMYIVPYGVDTDFFTPNYPGFKFLEGKFNFLSVALLTLRKGADIIIRAFLECFAQNNDVALVLRWFYNVSSFEKIKEYVYRIRKNLNIFTGNIYLLDTVHEAILPSLYNSCHVYIAPFRGEGWGLPIIEALACELPVITTGWGGVKGYLNDKIANFIDYELEQVPYNHEDYITRYGGIEGHLWAEPDINSLKQLMLDSYRNYKEYKKKARLGREYLIKNFTWEKSAETLLKYIYI